MAEKHRDHALTGDWKDHRDCHIKPDLILIYRKCSTDVLQLVRVAAFAEKLGWTKARLNEPIRGKRGITAAAALDLADVLGTSPKPWMNLQATYDLDKASRERQVA